MYSYAEQTRILAATRALLAERPRHRARMLAGPPPAGHDQQEPAAPAPAILAEFGTLETYHAYTRATAERQKGNQWQPNL